MSAREDLAEDLVSELLANAEDDDSGLMKEYLLGEMLDQVKDAGLVKQPEVDVVFSNIEQARVHITFPGIDIEFQSDGTMIVSNGTNVVFHRDGTATIIQEGA